MDKHIRLATRGKFLTTCVRSRLLYSVQAWELTEYELSKVEVIWQGFLRKMVRVGFERKNAHLKYVGHVCRLDKSATDVLQKQVIFDLRTPRKILTWIKRLLDINVQKARRIFFFNPFGPLGSIGHPPWISTSLSSARWSLLLARRSLSWSVHQAWPASSWI